MMDLRKLTTKEFAEAVGVDYDTLRELMRECSHLGYTDKPYYHTTQYVLRASIKEEAREIVAKFIYTNLFNRPEHRFYDTRGDSITLRGC